jgi:transposase-like protein
MIGVRADGRKELVALADGFRESAESWADLLRDCKRCGMRAPVLAVGDGRWGSGRPWGTCSPKPPSNAAGGTEAGRK